MYFLMIVKYITFLISELFNNIILESEDVEEMYVFLHLNFVSLVQLENEIIENDNDKKKDLFGMDQFVQMDHVCVEEQEKK